MPVELILLRFIHVVGGIFWVGSAIFMAFFLMPALKQAGPATAGAVMGAMQQRKVMVWMPIVAILVILSGARLMMIVSGGDSHWFLHRTGHTYSVAAAMAVLALLIGITVNRPAMVKAGKLSQSAATADEATRAGIQAEVARLQRRGAIGGTIATWLLILAAVGMAIARYL